MNRAFHQHGEEHGIQKRCGMIGDQNDRLSVRNGSTMLEYDPSEIKVKGRPHDDLGDRIQHGAKLIQITEVGDIGHAPLHTFVLRSKMVG